MYIVLVIGKRYLESVLSLLDVKTKNDQLHILFVSTAQHWRKKTLILIRKAPPPNPLFGVKIQENSEQISDPKQPFLGPCNF